MQAHIDTLFMLYFANSLSASWKHWRPIHDHRSTLFKIGYLFSWYFFVVDTVDELFSQHSVAAFQGLNFFFFVCQQFRDIFHAFLLFSYKSLKVGDGFSQGLGFHFFTVFGLTDHDRWKIQIFDLIEKFISFQLHFLLLLGVWNLFCFKLIFKRFYLNFHFLNFLDEFLLFSC